MLKKKKARFAKKRGTGQKTKGLDCAGKEGTGQSCMKMVTVWKNEITANLDKVGKKKEEKGDRGSSPIPRENKPTKRVMARLAKGTRPSWEERRNKTAEPEKDRKGGDDIPRENPRQVRTRGCAAWRGQRRKISTKRRRGRKMRATYPEKKTRKAAKGLRVSKKED